MSDVDPGTWVLPARLTLDTVAALFLARAGQPGAIRTFDLSQVQDMDSAGVALLHWFRAQQRALGLVPAPVRGDAAARYQALCQAHRVDDAAQCCA